MVVEKRPRPFLTDVYWVIYYELHFDHLLEEIREMLNELWDQYRDVVHRDYFHRRRLLDGII